MNSNNIIQKTKDNFLNPQASKYLFNDKIVIEGKEVLIKEIDNFEEADNQNINIKFTTIEDKNPHGHILDNSRSVLQMHKRK